MAMPIAAQSIHEGKKEPMTLICGPTVSPLSIRHRAGVGRVACCERQGRRGLQQLHLRVELAEPRATQLAAGGEQVGERTEPYTIDRKSTRLNSSHGSISYAVFCL